MNGTMKKTLVLLVAVVALVAAGCGGSDGGSPEDVVSTVYEGAADGDAAKVCDNLSESALEAAGGDSCEDELEPALEMAGALLEGVEVGEASVEGEEGTVEISFAGDTQDVPVVQEDGEWKVDEGF